ncbi:TIGR02391 family protein [Rhodomicrobium udaipurense]|uniref:TIGR02391 family protein n=1 Tax=Rhodomicrobium udaipurense TaxID=1202716 RepID=A0A8I1GH78_9HYPH|nr:TIGR02391 family protein [Rhodomicrobium udaipurense]MBJ7544778.1 TIGR02391 family protein [Rhodomicrobium udaipurense]
MGRLSYFEKITRRAHLFSEAMPANEKLAHPFSIRNIHPKLPRKVLSLFDDGHYSEATFEAAKFLDKIVQKISGDDQSGYKLMLTAFGGDRPKITLTRNNTLSDKDEQAGYRFIFTGLMQAIRNPKGHEIDIKDDLDTCLDHLSFISLLIRRLEKAGYIV